MSSPSIEKEILDQLKKLALSQQREVLNFAKALESARPAGVAGRVLLPFVGTIPPDDLRIMEQAIEEGCEKVNLNEW